MENQSDTIAFLSHGPLNFFKINSKYDNNKKIFNDEIKEPKVQIN